VAVDGHGDQEQDVRILSALNDADLRGGVKHLPKIGTEGIVLAGTPGAPLVWLGCVNNASEEPADTGEELSEFELNISERAPSVLDPKFAGDDPYFSKVGDTSFRAGQAKDVLPGDWAVTGTDGNAVGVYDGGVTVFKASDLAQIVGSKVGDLIRIVASRFQLMTDFGELRFESDKDRAWMEFSGNSDKKAGNPLGKNASKIEMELGSRDSLFKLSVVEGSETKAKLEINQNGEIVLQGVKIIEETPAGTKTLGASVTDAISADRTVKIDGADTTTSNKQVTTTGTYEMNVDRGSHSTTVPNGAVYTTGSKCVEKWLGYDPKADAVPAPSLISGKSVSVVTGDYDINVGDPLEGGVIAARPTMNINAWQGDVNITAGPLGPASVIISAPGAPSPLGAGAGIVLNSPLVTLGGVPGNPYAVPGSMAVCKWEALMLYLEALHVLLETHIHGTGVGPSSPPIGAPAFFNPAFSLASAIMSTTTRVVL
tara:strand:- start:1288 stop:2739 length:1452 start_codon:yes stop_codon:yes gene_type:complete